MHTFIQLPDDRLAMLASLHLEDSGVPVYLQIRDQMLRAIGRGELSPGEQMPTMRQVAVALKVDLNTVRRAYTELEQSGAIVIVRARGTFVADRPPASVAQDLGRRTRELAMQVVGMARAAGVDPLELGQCVIDVANQLRRSS